MDALNWRCGLGYDVIRKNRESLRDLKIQELLDSCCVFLKEYPDYIISEAGDIFSTSNRKVKKLSTGRKASGYRFMEREIVTYKDQHLTPCPQQKHGGCD